MNQSRLTGVCLAARWQLNGRGVWKASRVVRFETYEREYIDGEGIWMLEFGRSGSNTEGGEGADGGCPWSPLCGSYLLCAITTAGKHEPSLPGISHALVQWIILTGNELDPSYTGSAISVGAWLSIDPPFPDRRAYASYDPFRMHRAGPSGSLLRDRCFARKVMQSTSQSCGSVFLIVGCKRDVITRGSCSA